MPTKSNNTGGAGGKRPGAGRKPKALTEKEANGSPGGRALKIMDIPDVNGVTMPKPHDFLSSTQRDGGQLQANRLWNEVYLSTLFNRLKTKRGSLDGDPRLGFGLAFFGLRDEQGQNARLIGGLDILGLYLADIEAAGQCACVTLLTDDAALLVFLILVKALCGADGEVAVLEVKDYLVLLKARQVDGQAVALGIVGLTDIGLHEVSAVLTEQLVMAGKEAVVKNIIKKVFTVNSR